MSPAQEIRSPKDFSAELQARLRAYLVKKKAELNGSMNYIRVGTIEAALTALGDDDPDPGALARVKAALICEVTRPGASDQESLEAANLLQDLDHELDSEPE